MASHAGQGFSTPTKQQLFFMWQKIFYMKKLIISTYIILSTDAFLYTYIYIYTVSSTNIGTLDKYEQRQLWK